MNDDRYYHCQQVASYPFAIIARDRCYLRDQMQMAAEASVTTVEKSLGQNTEEQIDHQTDTETEDRKKKWVDYINRVLSSVFCLRYNVDEECNSTIELQETATKYLHGAETPAWVQVASKQEDLRRPESFYDMFLSDSVKASKEYRNLIHEREISQLVDFNLEPRPINTAARPAEYYDKFLSHSVKSSSAYEELVRKRKQEADDNDTKVVKLTQT